MGEDLKSLSLGAKLGLGWIGLQALGLFGLSTYYEFHGRIGLPIWAIFVLTVMQAIYFVPGLLGSFRHHPQELPIWMVNIFLGWTFIGWVAALVWSLTTQADQTKMPAPVPQSADLVKALEDILALKTKGLITEEEYQAKRAKLLSTI